MASYSIENDSIGGGGLGGIGFGGGSWGLLILIFLFFSMFSKRDGYGHDGGHYGHHDIPCGGTSGCQIDKDVLTSRDAGIIEQNRIYEKGLERKILERDMVIQEQKNQLFVGGMFAELKEGLNAKFGIIERQLDRKPDVVPHFAKTVDACVQPQMNCFDRFRDNDCGRNDRNDCCFC